MRKPEQTGFTMVELMIAVVVLAILLAVAIPSFRTIIENNRRTTTLNSLLSALQLARAEAVKRSGEVVVCHSNDGATCSGSGWNEGWIVFSDPDEDGLDLGAAACNAGQDCLLRVSNPVEDGITVSSVAGSLTYLPSGRTGEAGTVSFVIKIDDCTGTVERARQVDISLTGRPNVTEETCS